MKRLALNPNSLFKQPAHNPASRNQCCPCKREESTSCPAAQDHTQCDEFKQLWWCIFPIPFQVRVDRTLCFTAGLLCVITITVKLQVIKWETSGCKFCSRNTIDAVVCFIAFRHVQFGKASRGNQWFLNATQRATFIHFPHWFRVWTWGSFLTTTRMFQALHDSVLSFSKASHYSNRTALYILRNLAKEQSLLQNMSNIA